MELPAILLHGVVEVSQKRNLLVKGDGHVILNCVEASQDNVEKSDGDKKLMVKLLDDGSEASTCQVEEAEAFL
jgi:hypothetical protein